MRNSSIKLNNNYLHRRVQSQEISLRSGKTFLLSVDSFPNIPTSKISLGVMHNPIGSIFDTFIGNNPADTFADISYNYAIC